MTYKYTETTCPKDWVWFENGGRCGWSKACRECSYGVTIRELDNTLRGKTRVNNHE